LRGWGHRTLEFSSLHPFSRNQPHPATFSSKGRAEFYKRLRCSADGRLIWSYGSLQQDLENPLAIGTRIIYLLNFDKIRFHIFGCSADGRIIWSDGSLQQDLEYPLAIDTRMLHALAELQWVY
jgi:hypothetical protein